MFYIFTDVLFRYFDKRNTRIKHSIHTVLYKSTQQYLTDLLHFKPNLKLNTYLLTIPNIYNKYLGRSFRYSVAIIWNNL